MPSDAIQGMPQHYATATIAIPQPMPPGAVAPPGPLPGRPLRPELVPPLSLKRRAVRTPQGRAAMIHALAHIEFNAINLALDALWRFPRLPPQYYADWLRVAAEESHHFTLLAAHLHLVEQMLVCLGDNRIS